MTKVEAALSKILLSHFPLISLRRGLKYVFVFHDVSSISSSQHYPVYSTPIEIFENQITWLKNHFQLVSLADLTHEEGNKYNFASIVFDDGFKSVRVHALPILQKKNIPFAVFVNQNAILNNWLWCSNLFMAHKNNDETYLRKIYDYFSFTHFSYEAFRLAPAESLFSENKLDNQYDIFFDEKYSSSPIYLDKNDISVLLQEDCLLGSHSVNHKLLSACNDETLEDEILNNKFFLEELTGKAIEHFAIPFGFDGTFDARTIAIAKKYHSFIYSTERKYFRDSHHPALPRIGLRNENVHELICVVNLTLAIGLKNRIVGNG